jgi:hypothetical protein
MRAKKSLNRTKPIDPVNVSSPPAIKSNVAGTVAQSGKPVSVMAR